MKKRYIGIMSGTSLDGVDVALCKINERECTLEASHFLVFEESLKNQILNVIDGETTLKEIGEIDNRLALLFGQAVNELLVNTKLDAKDIIAIGSHGQTLWHEPNGRYPFSLQLGNPSLLAVETGIDVVADFRSKDVAQGGQGAPFAPAFHHFLFAHLKASAVLNIGGMANISVFEPKLIGYDTGCGNVLMDLWIYEKKNFPFDRDGAWAKSGKINEVLLNVMLSDKYFLLKFPKSTGREYFNKKFLRKYLEPFDKIQAEDIQATLLALTVRTIAQELEKFTLQRLLVCGGGVKNIFLIESLKKALPHIKIQSSDEYAVSSDNMEAMIFAWFAFMRLEKRPVELKSVTGAKKNTILGGIYAKD